MSANGNFIDWTGYSPKPNHFELTPSQNAEARDELDLRTQDAAANAALKASSDYRNPMPPLSLIAAHIAPSPAPAPVKNIPSPLPASQPRAQGSKMTAFEVVQPPPKMTRQQLRMLQNLSQAGF